MFTKKLTLALAFASAASAAPAFKRHNSCQDAYKICIAGGAAEVVCSCALAVCFGQDNARNREYCASATASLVKPTTTGIPGGCNPAHPGSCPSSYFTYTTATPTSTSTPTSGIPGGCNPAHPGSCPSSYFLFTTVTRTTVETVTSVPGIPGGCNPAHPGSCPSSYFTYPTVSASSSVSSPTSSPAAATPTPKAPSTGYTDPVPVEGKKWSIADLTRYCGEGNSGCDYNFVLKAGNKTERCTVIRTPGSNAASESWSEQPCTAGSSFKISWGYVKEPAPAFAVITVVNGKELAWFGVSNVNGQPVTPSSPFGSGQFGNLGPEQVYTY